MTDNNVSLFLNNIDNLYLDNKNKVDKNDGILVVDKNKINTNGTHELRRIGTNRNGNNRNTFKIKDSCELDKEPIENTLFASVIYRYKFTESFMEELYQFSKIHQYDHRKDFKEAWELWTVDNKDMIDDEIIRMTGMGYDGDIIDKMFKSARYYFRKKSTEKKEPKTRTPYIKVTRELLEAMDKHIAGNKLEQPKIGFIDFCKENEIVLKETLKNIRSQGVTDSETIERKIKKTYKNRYFMIANKHT